MQETTSLFSGLVSMMMPNNSWVAKWNGISDLKPGIYAVKILEEDNYDDDIQETKNTRSKRNRKRRQGDDYYPSDANYSDFELS